VRRASAAVLLLISSVALAQSTPQYLPFKMVNTTSNPFRYYLDNRNAMPAGLNLLAVQNATNNAWNSWNAVSCAVPKTATSGYTSGIVPNPADSYDAFNVTPVWILSATDPLHYALFGSAYVKGIAIPLTYAGVLTQCDIFLNGVGISWSVTATTAVGTVDLETVMLHEAGHCLGMDHWQPDFPDISVMVGAVQEGFQRRTPSSKDVEALCARNPVQGGIGSPCLADGGCGAATASGAKCITQPLASGQAKFCTVGCAAGTGFVCELPLYCEASTYFNPTFSGTCLRAVDTVTRVGAPCTMNGQCNSALGLCQPEDSQPSGFKRWTQGYCYQTCAAGQPGCPAGSQCTNVGAPDPICLLSCRVGLADCRSGYSCAQSVNGGVCIPSCFQDIDCGDVLNYQCRTCDGLCVARQNSAGQIGDACTQDQECGAGQLCAKLDVAKAARLCTISCGSGCGSCPSGSTCHPIAPTNALSCLKTCTGAGTCPTGSRCANLPTGRGCMPPCLQNLDCPVGEDCVGGDCFGPGYDAGCGAFCPTVDAGKPIIQPKKDAGTGGGGSGGCGCSSALELSGLLAVVLVGWALGRRRPAPAGRRR